MHILYVQQILVLPGARGNDRCWAFAKQWTEAGHKITFLTSNSGFSAKKTADFKEISTNHFLYQGIEIHVIDVDYDHQMRFRKRIQSFATFFWKALKRGKTVKQIDVILAYTAPLSVAELGRKLAKYHQKPFFLEVADPWPEVPIGMGVIRNSLLIKFLINRTRKIYHYTTHIFAFSDGIKDQILNYNIPKEKVSIIYNGADLSQFSYNSQRKEPSSRIKAIYAGTIGLANDLTQFAQAAKLIENRGINHIDFMIIGDGNDLQRVKNFVDSHQIKSFQFFPKVERKELSNILEQADVGIVSFATYKILETNSATKFYDYLAMGLPMVINYEGWQAKYLEAYQCGLAAPQGNMNQLVENILFLATNPKKRKEYGENGQRLAREKFDRKKMAGQELTIIKTCLDS